MADGKFIAYYRVSTDKQGKSGLGLESQRQAVVNFIYGNGNQVVAEFTEIESGKRKDRPELAKALAVCKKHKAKLVIAKLDRLARNVHFISGLMESGVDFVAVDMPEANKLTVHILAAVAEHEREMISQRTKAALAAAKDRGVKLGNPINLSEAQSKSVRVRQDQADQFAANVLPVIKTIQSSGARTLRDIAEALNNRGIRTARSGSWHPASVKRILKRNLDVKIATGST
jgi:DNA invertase Pin-like site-specific DNA recombinase